MSEKETLAQQAYKDLKQRILQGTFKAGDLLTERTLAGDSGISRTPLRAAISRLEKEGVVSRLANGALMVRPVTLEQLLEIIQIRRLLEAAAAARAAERPFTDALNTSRVVMQDYADGKDTAFDNFWMDDDRFHEAVADAAGLALLPGMLNELRSIARRCTITRTHDRFADQAREHIAVIDAIEERDAPRAAAAMEAHFDSAKNRFLGWLSRP
ncbi:GntR family transcriptional regulator [Rhizobium sp. RM]|uniref:GntR family transcriptional regulator n=1 Tax=Rhizobium sp. RM TaxID=2748079 RepID=UPI00110E82FA|nr:GntR family transcriptional regulator [Rhizobium sp. RM]NWJ27424.1 GntR family transcriptional regulator [Rhizobium sp. RM]TMV20474.1 GntR family transcriptional regulator [Rhizobium sp. Td3]